ncbi:HEAT repeat domain-containing protein [Micromonospora chersina]|uniref:HEAT repeat domain-containing protein n=1 Tax=Micromonospora chersina TaxID=47854 RepID=UPI0037233326
MSHDVRGLSDPDRSVRLTVLDRLLLLLARDGDDDAVQALRAVVAGYRRFDTEIYTRALHDIGLFGDASLAGPLLDCLADADYGCQAWAATACGRLGIDAAGPLLIDLLAHPDGLAREAACQALGQLGDEAAIAPLAARLDDPAEFVRAAAGAALAEIGGQRALASLWGAFESRSYPRLGYVAAALAQFGPLVFDRLVQATRHDDPEMRFWAARALGSTGDPRASATLTRLVAEDDGVTRTGAHVRTAARTALKTLRRTGHRTSRDEETRQP